MEDELYDVAIGNTAAVAGAGETPQNNNLTLAAVGVCTAAQEAMIESVMAPGRQAADGVALSSEHAATMQRVEMVVSDGSCKRVRSGKRGGEDYDFVRRAGGYDESIVDVDAATGREVFRCARCFRRAFEAVDVSRFLELNPRLREAFSDPNYQYCTLQCVFSVACEVVGLERRDMRAQFLTELEDVYGVDASAICYVPAASPYQAACEVLAESGATQEEIADMMPVSAWGIPLMDVPQVIDTAAGAAAAAAAADSAVEARVELSPQQAEYQAFHQAELDASQAAAEAYGQHHGGDDQLTFEHYQQQFLSYHAAALIWPPTQ